MPTDRVEALFKLAGPPTYVNVADIAPCSFNRGSGIVKVASSHCLTLIEKIIDVEGFGETRYKMVWLHTPNQILPIRAS